MVVLSDRDLKRCIKEGKIVIEGMTDDQIGPSSVDLTLGDEFRIFKHCEVTHIDPREGNLDHLMDIVKKSATNAFIIHPGEFILATTKEYVKVPDDMIARLDGRSSWGRLGIVVHSTAGSVHPGFEGKLTLEMANISKVPVKLWPGSRICQLTFEMMSSPAENPYNKRKGSKYSGQINPGISKISLDSRN
ncbi:MAG: dCTP deaminase [Candidatus Woesearchaeota archaeon]|nr:dCTP deaminase [Candidatus Woesearchaeota archaeon]